MNHKTSFKYDNILSALYSNNVVSSFVIHCLQEKISLNAYLTVRMLLCKHNLLFTEGGLQLFQAQFAADSTCVYVFTFPIRKYNTLATTIKETEEEGITRD